MKRSRVEPVNSSIESFQELIKKAYEQGTSDTDITVVELLENIKNGLRNILSH